MARTAQPDLTAVRLLAVAVAVLEVVTADVRKMRIQALVGQEIRLAAVAALVDGTMTGITTIIRGMVARECAVAFALFGPAAAASSRQRTPEARN